MSGTEAVFLRVPTLKDGMDVFRLIENCPPLDRNSSYCNLLQCSHFAHTSIIAEEGGEIVGFVSGHVIPERLDTLFIWQVAVAERARGRGLALQMLTQILERSYCNSVAYVECSISPHNHASWALFRGVAKRLKAGFQSSSWMDKEVHFSGQHESEMLVRIGPLQ